MSMSGKLKIGGYEHWTESCNLECGTWPEQGETLKWEHREDRNRFWYYSNRRCGRGPRQLSACKFRGTRRTGPGLVPVSLGRLGRQTRLWMGGAGAARKTGLDRGAFNQAPLEERGSLQRDCNRWPEIQLESSRHRDVQRFAPRA